MPRKVRVDARSRELASSGSSVSISAATSIVGVSADCVYDASASVPRRVVVLVNPHRRPGEHYDSFDVRIEADEDTMEILARRMIEAVDRWRKAGSKTRRGVSGPPGRSG